MSPESASSAALSARQVSVPGVDGPADRRMGPLACPVAATPKARPAAVRPAAYARPRDDRPPWLHQLPMALVSAQMPWDDTASSRTAGVPAGGSAAGDGAVPALRWLVRVCRDRRLPNEERWPETWQTDATSSSSRSGDPTRVVGLTWPSLLAPRSPQQPPFASLRAKQARSNYTDRDGVMLESGA